MGNLSIQLVSNISKTHSLACGIWVSLGRPRSYVFSLLIIIAHVQATKPANAESLNTILANGIDTRTLVGAQLIEGTTTAPSEVSTNLGFITPLRRQPVTDQTMFCVASCSKPLMSFVIFRLIDQGKLSLDTPVDQWLPAIANPKLVDGSGVTAPTLQQLLAHRAGIYSQKEKLKPDQLRAIRDFRLTLSQSVNQITRHPLISKPGSRYAYSGAGYCLIGAIAENATRQPIDVILQKQLCDPLGLASTTFFPNQRPDSLVATGGQAKEVPPHLLGNAMRLPLVGGSIHTTAADLQIFARMVAGRGMVNEKKMMKQKNWSTYVSAPYHAQRYGYGWTRTTIGDNVILSHNGSLPPAQATLKINLTTGEYTIALWTLANPSDAKTTSQIRSKIRRVMNES
jgi:CubicO group peptidase (beta-lactamase class C family)